MFQRKTKFSLREVGFSQSHRANKMQDCDSYPDVLIPNSERYKFASSFIEYDRSVVKFRDHMQKSSASLHLRAQLNSFQVA